MPDWIVQHWAKWLFGLIGTGVVTTATVLWRKLRGRKTRMDKLEERLDAIDEKQKGTEAQNDAMMAALRASMYDRLYYLHGKFMKQGWVSIPGLENVTSIYEGYCGLNGNHMGPKLYEDICNLPHFEPM
jgi:hypothetical protein